MDCSAIRPREKESAVMMMAKRLGMLMLLENKRPPVADRSISIFFHFNLPRRGKGTRGSWQISPNSFSSPARETEDKEECPFGRLLPAPDFRTNSPLDLPDDNA